ncbi:NB-ARC domain-containing protein [Actinoplanes sp. NPDC000266]
MSLAPPYGLRDPAHPVRGRQALIRRVTRNLSGKGMRYVHVLHGMGGCGKTAVALEAAQIAQSRGLPVWWIEAAETPVIMASLQAVGRQVGVPDEDALAPEALDRIWEHLRDEPEPWLLVINNINDLTLLSPDDNDLAEGRGLIRPLMRGRGTVIVTTRTGSREVWGSGWSVLHHVGDLDPEDAGQVLMDRTVGHAGLVDDAISLGSRLGGLPLALNLASAYLSNVASLPITWRDTSTVATFSALEKAFEQGRFTLSDEAGQAALIERLWGVTLSWLDRRGMPEARALLGLLCHFAEYPIPEAVLHPHTLAESGLLGAVDGIRLRLLVNELSNVNLVETSTRAVIEEGKVSPVPAIRVHPLLRATLRASINADERRSYVSVAVGLIRHWTDANEDPHGPEAWPTWQLISPHAIYLSSEVDDTTLPTQTKAIEAAAQASRHLQRSGGLTRLTVNLTPRSAQALDALHEATAIGKTDIVNRALQLYKFVQEAEERGQQIELRDPDGTVHRVQFL